MTKFLLISQARSGSTKTFHYVADKLRHENRIKEFQQLDGSVYKDNDWKRTPAIGVLTDPVFMNNKRKRVMINSVIKHAEDNGYSIISLLRRNFLKRNISKQYAHYKDDWSFTNKSEISEWSLDVEDLVKRVEQDEKNMEVVDEIVSQKVSPINALYFEDLFESPSPQKIVFNEGDELSLSFYRETYPEIQKEMYRKITNLDSIPKRILEKYTL